MSTSPERSIAPAYVAYRTFANSLNKMKENGLPARIDASVFAGQSGSTVSALLATYRFLGLTEDDGKPSDMLRALIEREENDRGSLLRMVLEERYPFLQPPAFDLSGATTQQVEAAFREQGIGGSTITKAVSFFMAASAAAGMQISKYIKTSSVKRTGAGKSKRAAKSKAVVSPLSELPAQKAPTKSLGEQLLAKFPDFDPTWDDAIKTQWFESFASLRNHMLKESDQ